MEVKETKAAKAVNEAKPVHSVFFVSLGCDKNLVDSEHMLGILSDRGFAFTDDCEKAEVIVINTCCFIGDAKDESIEAILNYLEYKKSGNLKCLVVAGCMAERYRDEILSELPEVDIVLGTNAIDQIADAINSGLHGEKKEVFVPLSGIPKTGSRRITSGQGTGYLKIAEGCDKHCTYCIIPSLRGSYRSVPMENLLREARELAADGVRELVLVAQETTVYGKDIYGEKSLHILIDKLCEIEGIKWIRILYCYPEEIYPKLVETMKRQKKVCHYLDLPIQHANDEILRKMGRRTSKKELIDIIAGLRDAMPDITLRTTLITGFPGESKAQHEELLQFVSDVRFDRLGVFTYSREENTPAAEFPDQVEESVKKKRQDEIMKLQQGISGELYKAKVGSHVTAMIEGKVADENVYVARTMSDAPSVDGYLFIESDANFMTGDFVRAAVTGAMEYDLMGELLDEDEYTE